MTFIKPYAFSAIGLNFLLAAFTVEWSLITNGVFDHLMKGENGKLQLGIINLINADFCAGAILISFGGVIGKTTATQLLMMALLEPIFYSINASIFYIVLKGVDMGGSITIHTFGAYFGLALSMVLSTSIKNDKGENIAHPRKMSNQMSDLFSMVRLVLIIY